MGNTTREPSRPLQRQVRADREATRAAVFAGLALLVFGVGVGLACAGVLDAIGSVVLIAVVPIALSLAASDAAKNALKNGTNFHRRARFAAVVGVLWQVVAN